MNLEEAKHYLSQFKRIELRDHAFSDREIEWLDSSGNTKAYGYFGGAECSVAIGDGGAPRFDFIGDAAKELAECGSEVVIGRNDTCGPDIYGGP